VKSRSILCESGIGENITTGPLSGFFSASLDAILCSSPDANSMLTIVGDDRDAIIGVNGSGLVPMTSGAPAG